MKEINFLMIRQKQTSRFFNSTFSNRSFSLPPISDLPTPSTQFHEISFDSLEVYEALRKLDTSKAMGTDNLHPHLLKMCALMIHKSVTHYSTASSRLKQYLKNGQSTKLFPFQRKVTLHLSRTTVLYLFLVFCQNFWKG